MNNSANKKILFVANVDREHINKFHIPTIRFFKSKGWTVDVACGGNMVVPECDTRFNGKWSRSPFRLGTFSGILQLIKILKQNNYDVVYCHTPVGGLVARAAVSFLKNKPKVAYFAHGLHFYKGGPKKIWLTVYPMERLLSRVTDLLITLNSEDYELAQEKLSKKAKIVLSNGIGVNFERLYLEDKGKTRKAYREKLGIKDETTVLIYIAELLKNKNQAMLIKALKELSDNGEGAILVLVGPDYSDGSFKRFAEEFGVADKVIFTGWRNDVAELLAMADICVASSIREGFGINLVEAMYLGLPVVATDNRGHKMVIKDGENGFLVPINDSAAMAERVEQLINEKALREKLSNIDVSKYDANVIAEKLYDEINSMTHYDSTESIT